MSQHDYLIDNADGATFRADLNSVLAAIVSSNSGNAAPAVTRPFLLWFDTSAGVLKQRNAADTAWLSAVTADTLPPQADMQAAFKNLKIAAQGATNFSAVVTADAVTLLNPTTGAYVTRRAVSVTAAANAAGSNGLDTGTLAASTWYYVFVIYNPTTQATAALLSLSATAPTLPAGFTFFARVGAVRSQAASPFYLLQTLQYGRRVEYVVTAGTNVASLPQVASGTVGSVVTPTWVAAAVAGFVPPTATVIFGLSAAGVAGTVMVAPNSAYGAANSTMNPPPFVSSVGNGAPSVPFVMTMQSGSIFWASNAAATLNCTGWEDNI